jgi:hypothetical protein
MVVEPKSANMIELGSGTNETPGTGLSLPHCRPLESVQMLEPNRKFLLPAK